TKDQLAGTVGEATEGVVRWDTDANGKYVDGSLRGMHFLSKKEGIVSFGADNKVLINGTTGQFFADSIVANNVTTQTLTAGNGKVKVDENGKLSTTGEVSMMNGTGELVSLTDDNGLTMMTSGDYGTGMLTVDNGRINMRGGTTTTITIDNSGTTFTNLKDNTSTTIQGNTITTGTIHADGMTVGGKDVATVDDVTNATKDAVKYDEKGELHAGKDGTGSLALEKENGSASLISGNGKHSISVGNDGTTINGGLNVNGGLTVDGDTVATSGDVTEVRADVSGIKTEIGVDENGNYKTIENGAGDVITGINNNTSYIKGIKDQIGATGENGALNLSNGATTIEGGINQNTTAIQQNSQAINSLGHRVSDLGDEIDSVGAISAALAGLHPLDYDGTGSKFQISAAMGTYDGTQAAAIGGFYHFNRDVMMSLGGATSFEGDKKTAANIGVTFRVGEGASGKTVSNDILARLEAMDQKIAALEQENKELKNVLGAIDTSLSKEFPDVPANHWAYEAVTKLAGNDVVAGYPDGEFHGDRTMTRYEMAEIIYKAMNRGAKVDQKLVEEFKPEMEQVAANETAQAQSTPAQEAPAQDAQ
ncbi:S-layer homology domain-containing protein, partial [Megasphaera stantonii]|uniref:S-layer homology domain-containing protein n=1 Tax=Megasphaera stantonii TaxID=2144175 RepID=UPI00195D9FFF